MAARPWPSQQLSNILCPLFPPPKQTAQDEGSAAPLVSGSSTRRAGQFKCVGAIRKAGFLSVKKWILKRHKSIELARKQGWKRYWVCLRGSALLFHSLLDSSTSLAGSPETSDLLTWIQANSGGQSAAALGSLPADSTLARCYIETEPKHLIIIEGSIAQPIPEHPKREHVFCLSTTFGDAYLFQASCQIETDNWIAAIHNACAASLARDLTRDEASKFFETRVRRLELEADKKLFLRQRLESRLASMSSMNRANQLASGQPARSAMHGLMRRLQQQLVALDVYIEQVHCEVYQLRCYLSSCQPNSPNTDLPHPRSLLIHVSKPTKLTLIKLGVFTVSSFHAFIHARQGSAESILLKLHQKQLASAQKPLELRVGTQTISEQLLLLNRSNEVKLEQDSEHLINLTNLLTVQVRLSRSLYQRILDSCTTRAHPTGLSESETDSVIELDDGQHLLVQLKLHPSSDAFNIIKRVLSRLHRHADPLSDRTCGLFDFLDYFLEISSSNSRQIARRRETLADWANFDHLWLLEKYTYRVELTRSSLDDEAHSSPFGISIGAQLFSSELESQLNVFCSYVEWGSVAEKAGLKDEDEILVMNGIPVVDLDMMFVECILQEESKLKLLIRSSRSELVKDQLQTRAKSLYLSEDEDDQDDQERKSQLRQFHIRQQPENSKLITDEYISSLVCPPPPASHSGLHEKLSHQEEIEPNMAISSADGSPNHSATLSMFDTDRHDASLVFRPTSQASSCTDVTNQLIEKTQRLVRLLCPPASSNQVDRMSTSTSRAPIYLESSTESSTDTNSLERLKKSVLELLETEYAYVRQLETIHDHYMGPLRELDFLAIVDLEQLSAVVNELIVFQRGFFDKLSRVCRASDQSGQSDQLESADAIEHLDSLVHHMNSRQSLDELKSVLHGLSTVFINEADEFRIYARYCVAYSKLQKLLHTKKGQSSPNSHLATFNTINIFPPALDTFMSSNVNRSGSSLSAQASRELLKPFTGNQSGPSAASCDFSGQLKQLADFLANLDSSSSSVSLSLPRSSGSDATVGLADSAKKFLSRAASTSSSGLGPSYKSVHQQNFESYLIKPIQRIVRYPMLLNSITLTAQLLVEQEILDDLQSAIKHMESIASYVNDTQRVQEEYGLVFDAIQRQFHDMTKPTSFASATHMKPHQPPISLRAEHLLFSGEVDWLNMDSFVPKLKKGFELSQIVFVFSSCVVLICTDSIHANRKRLSAVSSSIGSMNSSRNNNSSHAKSNQRSISGSEFTLVVRFHTLIPVSEVQVRSLPSHKPDLPEQEAPNGRHRWELFRCSSVNSNSKLLTKSNQDHNSNGKVYLLSCSTNEMRSAFLRKIRLTIRESVRKMSLPLARSPSSKSLSPKKLSSPSSTTNTTTNSSCSQSHSLSPGTLSRDSNRNRTITNEATDCSLRNHQDTNYTAGIAVNN